MVLVVLEVFFGGVDGNVLAAVVAALSVDVWETT